ncbi:MAG TPA: hypothetical protein VFH51_15640 [Myxococcota bacterium]|nr:hypothetical protein [Myxococcota bacterium]
MTIQQPVSSERAAAAMELVSKRAKLRAELMQNEDVRWLMARAEQKGARDKASYLIFSLLLAVETYAQGDKMLAGQVMDDALTHFLAEYKAALGEEATLVATRALIHNIALFLPKQQRDAIHAVVGKHGGR